MSVCTWYAENIQGFLFWASSTLVYWSLFLPDTSKCTIVCPFTWRGDCFSDKLHGGKIETNNKQTNKQQPTWKTCNYSDILNLKISKTSQSRIKHRRYNISRPKENCDKWRKRSSSPHQRTTNQLQQFPNVRKEIKIISRFYQFDHVWSMFINAVSTLPAFCIFFVNPHPQNEKRIEKADLCGFKECWYFSRQCCQFTDGRIRQPCQPCYLEQLTQTCNVDTLQQCRHLVHPIVSLGSALATQNCQTSGPTLIRLLSHQVKFQQKEIWCQI